jgi:hypothetical protein
MLKIASIAPFKMLENERRAIEEVLYLPACYVTDSIPPPSVSDEDGCGRFLIDFNERNR